MTLPDFVPFPKIPELDLVRDTRVCPRCEVQELRSEFPGNSPLAICRYCKTYAARKRHRAWTAANREHVNSNARKGRAARHLVNNNSRDAGPKAREQKRWMIEIKSRPCADCRGKFDTCCMDFDHRDGTVKRYNVGSMFAHHYSRELILSELSKCDLVCSNCHRIRTRNRMTGIRKTNSQVAA